MTKAVYMDVPPRPKIKPVPIKVSLFKDKSTRGNSKNITKRKTFFDDFIAKRHIKKPFKFPEFKLKPRPQLDVLAFFIVLVSSLFLTIYHTLFSVGILGLFLIIHLWFNQLITLDKNEDK